MDPPAEVTATRVCPECGALLAAGGIRRRRKPRPRTPTQDELLELCVGGSRPSRGELRNVTLTLSGLLVLTAVIVLLAANWAAIRPAAADPRPAAARPASPPDETVDLLVPRR